MLDTYFGRQTEKTILMIKMDQMHVKTYLVKNFLARVRTCEDSASKTVKYKLLRGFYLT